MSHFEYVMVIVSIILGLGLTVILRGLARLARGALPCAVVVVWGFLLLFLFLQNWWAFWDLAQVTQWTQPSFLFVALYCCIMYAMAELMLPIGATPETDWTAHFLSIRKWFFSLLSLLTVLAVLLTYTKLHVPLTHPYRGIQGFVLLLSLTGLATTNMRVHLGIAVIILAVLLVGQLLFRLVPGLA
jgi:hypothetical protein